jgi:DHA2 family multidrug resistance protein
MNHADLAGSMTPFDPTLYAPWLPRAWMWQTVSGAVALNTEVTRQAATIAYLDDFTVMMWVTLLSAPLLLLLRRPPARQAAGAASAAE